GSSRGIGKAIAQACAHAGARVSAFSRTGADTPGLANFTCDIADAASIDRAFADARERNGAISMLVNNAGIAESAPLTRTTDELWHKILATNLTGTFLCTRAVASEMRQARFGRIVNIASTAGLYGAPYIVAYCASKHGVIGLTRALALEFAGSGLCINAICPGYTETNMMAQAISQIVGHTGVTEAQAREQLAATNPGGRIVMVDEVVDAALDLLTSERSGEEVILPTV
ncbi:MAG TPA: SDR family oxidoreductase, partial [Candidatus Dormibacteraeota bacterium]|nr:SDR family oxidoreductase [Candidatus Dormibacteraeota bacterium]